MNSAEDTIRFTRNRAVRKSVKHLRDGNPERAHTEMMASFRTQVRLSGLTCEETE